MKADLQVSFDKRIAEQVCFHIREKEAKLAIESDGDKQVSELERRESNLASRKSALEATVESLAEENKNFKTNHEQTTIKMKSDYRQQLKDSSKLVQGKNEIIAQMKSNASRLTCVAELAEFKSTRAQVLAQQCAKRVKYVERVADIEKSQQHTVTEKVNQQFEESLDLIQENREEITRLNSLIKKSGQALISVEDKYIKLEEKYQVS